MPDQGDNAERPRDRHNIRQSGDRVHRATRALLGCYARNPDFVDAFNGFIDKHRNAIEALTAAPLWPNGPKPPHSREHFHRWQRTIGQDWHWSKWRRTYSSLVGTDEHWSSEDSDSAIRAAVAEAEELAFSWGLRAGWAAGVVVNSAMDTLKYGHTLLNACETAGAWVGPREIDTATLSRALGVGLPPTLTVDESAVVFAMFYDPNMESWQDFQRRALEELRRQRAEIEEHYIDQGDWERAPHKSSLERHVEWLYLAICPDIDLGRPLRYPEIADAASFQGDDVIDESTVARATGGADGLAALLGIELPHGPGRPPGSTNISH